MPWSATSGRTSPLPPNWASIRRAVLERDGHRCIAMRGDTGEDKPDHCAHIGLMTDVIRVHLEPRWKSPKGRS